MLFLPQKLLITMAGATIGSLISNPSDIAEKLRNLGSTANDINKIFNDIFAGQFTISNGAVVIFFAVVFFCLLRAYEGQGD